MMHYRLVIFHFGYVKISNPGLRAGIFTLTVSYPIFAVITQVNSIMVNGDQAR